MRQAQHLDEILDSGGKPLGPLHGVPVALKVTISFYSHAGYLLN
jgi:amidase